MDDINFDELDKAVNSVLKQGEHAAKADSPVETPVVDVPPAPEVGVDEPKPAEKQVERASQKRRGQFMDMVHPSSDMIKPAPTQTRRQGTTLQPLDPSIVEAKQHEDKKNEELVTTQKEPIESATTHEEPSMKSEWPDPLDVMEQAGKEKQEERPSVHSEEVAGSQDSETLAVQPDVVAEKETETPDDTQEPAATPFINGSGLEKRPLGAFTDPASSEEPTEMGEDVTNEQEPVVPSQENVDSNELPAVPQVPQELAPEVVSVESDDPLTMANREVAADEEHEGSAVPEATGMAASISQQYAHTEEPTDGQDHPVFDTKEYHQPLVPPTKRHHTGLVVTLVIILLGLLGAGAWYAIFVLKLI